MRERRSWSIHGSSTTSHTSCSSVEASSSARRGDQGDGAIRASHCATLRRYRVRHMTLTSGTDEADASIPFEEFNRAMGADGDATPYPDLVDGRAARRRSRRRSSTSPTSTARTSRPELRLFTAYTYEAVQTVLGDGEHFQLRRLRRGDGRRSSATRSSRWTSPSTSVPRSLLQQAFTRKAMERWEDELVAPLINRMIDEFVDDGTTDLVRNLLFPFPVDVIAALLGLPERGPAPVPPPGGRADRRDRRHGTARSSRPRRWASTSPSSSPSGAAATAPTT